MLPLLVGMAAKSLMPSTKKIDKDKLLNEKKSSAIQKVDNERGIVKEPTIKKKTISTDLFLPPAKPKGLLYPGKEPTGKNLKEVFSKISDTLEDIIGALRNRESVVKVDKKNRKQVEQSDERKDKEKKLKTRKKKQLELKPKLPGDKFNIMKFFENILIGSIVLAIFKNLEKIVEFFEGLYNQFKNFLIKLGEVLSPIWNGLKWIASGGANVIAKILGIPSQEADTNGLKKNLEEITKKIPIIGDLFKGIQNTIDSIRGYKEPTEGGGGGGGGGGDYVSPAVGSKAGAYDIASKIGANNQQWDTFRNTIAQIESGGRYDVAGGSGKYYDGRYQMGGPAKTDAARILGIPDPGHSDNPNDPRRVAFRRNPELQEKMFAAYTLANHGYLSSDQNYQAKQTVEQKLQVLGYAHNQGAGGASKWMRTGKVGKDGFGTSGTKYSNALREAFKRSPSYRQQQADVAAQQAATQATQQATPPTPSPVKTSQTPQAAAQATPMPTQTPQVSPAQATPTPQVSPAQIAPMTAPSISAEIPQIMQQAEYEVSGQAPSTTIIPIPIGGTNQSKSMPGGTTILPVGMSKTQALNSYYQSQLIGFLYKQG